MSSNTPLDDTNLAIQYDPPSAWILDPNLGTHEPYNSTVHSTTQDNATATIRFTGTSISLSCLLWITGSNFTATLDGNLLDTYNTGVASQDLAVPKVMFTKTDLNGAVEHTLVIQKSVNAVGWVSTNPGDNKSHLNIDSISIVGQAIYPASSTPATPAGRAALSTGTMAGIVVGILALLLLLAAFLWYRRRKGSRLSTRRRATPFTETKTKDHDEEAKSFSLPPAAAAAAAATDSPPSPTAPGTAAAAPTPQFRGNQREKVGLVFANQAGGPGVDSRRGWRSSLLELPGHRVVRVHSRMPPPRADTTTTEEEEGGDGSVSNVGGGPGVRFASSPRPLLSIPTTNAQHTGPGTGTGTGIGGENVVVPETLFSPLSGPESHVTETTHHPSESTNPPSAVPLSPSSLSSSSPDATAPAHTDAHGRSTHVGTSSSFPSSSSPSSSSSAGAAAAVAAAARPQTRTGTTKNPTIPEKSSFQGSSGSELRQNNGTNSSLPLSASTIPANSLPSATAGTTTDDDSASGLGGLRATQLLRELAGLRDQVRMLTELHRGGADDDRSPYPEPPPEYVGRDSSDEEEGDGDGHTTRR